MSRDAGATLAPFGRRTLHGRRAPRRSAPTSCSRADDPDGPAPRAGQFYMLAAAERWGGGEDERPFLPRAFSVAARARRRACSSCSRTSARAPSGCASSSPATACGDRPARRSASRRPPTAAARCCAAAGSAPRRWPSGRTSCWPRGEPAPGAAGLPRRRPRRRAPTLLHNARVATDDGSHGHHGLVTDLLAAELDAERAGRRLRLRPAADARGGARAVRRARRPLPARARVRAWPAASAPASAASCRCATAATCACASTGPSLDGAPARGGAGALTARRLLRPAPRAPDRQRLGHLRRDRRAARVRRRAARATSRSRLRLQDDHAGAARRQPAAAAVRDAGRADQLDRPAQQGPARLPRARPARARARCRSRSITNVMGSTAAELVRAGRGASTRATRSTRSSSTSPARTSRPAWTSAPTPPSSAAVLAEVRPRTAKPLIVKLTPNTADVAAVAQAAEEAGADAVSLINTLRAYAPHPRPRRRRRGSAAGPAGCPARRSARSPSRRSARSPRASRSRSSAWAACRAAAHAARHARRRAPRWSPWAPRASAIRPREHGSHASLHDLFAKSGDNLG